MMKPKDENLVANSCDNADSHLSLTLIKDGVLSAKRTGIPAVSKGILFLIVFLLMQAGSVLYAQEWELRGKVTDAEDGSPIIGANIIEKGTTNGTATDVNGEFRLKVRKGSVLVISSVGYAKVEVTIVDQKYLEIAMNVEAEQLTEVVVVGIGYGEVKKSDATGSVAAISAKDFDKRVITSPQELLIGKAPGVVANTLSGEAGAAAQIRIRGGSSITANNDPLIVIDNIPLESTGISGMANPLSTINPNDIESITILKDASATAIYGSRASNGVIIIKTKKGLKGAERMLVNYTGNFSLSSPYNYMPVFSGDEFRALVQDRVENHGLTSAALDRLGNANTDWQKEIYQVAPETEHNISIRHSIGSVPYRLSLGYLYQDGILKYNNIDRKNVTLNLTPTLLDGNLTMEINGNASWISNNFSNTDAIGSAVEFDPTQPVKNGNTRYGGYTAWTELSSGDPLNGLPNNIATHNPVARLEYRDNTSTATRYIVGGKFDYNIPYVPGLKAILNLGYDYYKTDGSDITDTLASWSYREPEYQIREYWQKKTNSLLDLYLNYNKELGINKFDFTGGYSYQHFYNEGENSNRAWDPTVPGARVTPYKNEYFLISFFGRLNYTLLDKYLLTATIRYDGSSRFAENNRWGTFPAVAFAWKMTEEPFIGKSDLVNELKLRVSWGKTGQQDIGDDYYPYIPTYTLSTAGAYYQFGDQFYPTLRPDAYDANIKWEVLTSLNAGLDFSLLNNRVTGSIDVYKNNSDNLLNSIPIPVGSNFSNYLLTNVGSMVNKGVEVGLNITPILESDFSWDLGINMTYNKNEITKLTLTDDPNYPGVNTGDIAGGVGNTVQKFAVGYPARVFFLFTQVYDQNGNPIEGLYVDKSGQGGNVAGNELNKYYMKSPDPDYLVGISSRINYKNFDFSFSGRLSLGNYVYNNNASNRALYQQIYNQSGFLSNILTDVKKTNFTTAQYWSSFYLENASFFRMDVISVGYNFSSLFGNNIGGRIGLSVQNVFVITDYSGLDPEVVNGIDNNIYPRPRTYMMTISLNY
ncbi:SusC/RagA family TonB-linked outer membrane protein [Melioribacter sp. Ez-97]|uniref:SusC/RagA family TonB-linked outer membrane protein n=1 Tax=Melioribacter sp. Ez-97 TaxID=3423434 RepID=UPI003EDA2D43